MQSKRLVVDSTLRAASAPTASSIGDPTDTRMSTPKEPPATLPGPFGGGRYRLSGDVFVGREREMQLLRAGVEAAGDGRGRLILIGGEPGAGKTRLLAELATYAGSRGAAVVWGRCGETPGAPAFWLWAQVVRACLPRIDLAALRGTLGPAANEIAALAPEIRASWVDLPATLDTGSEHASFRLFDGVATCLYGVAETRPLVVLLDDLQWADTPSLRLLEFVAARLPESRVLIVGTYREVAEDAIGRLVSENARVSTGVHLTLGGLGEEDVQRLLMLVADVVPPPALVSALYRQTDGNPFFVTEVARLLVAEGLLHGSMPGDAVRLPIPPTVQAALTQRLSRLSETTRQALTVAAVAGRDLDLALLARMADLSVERLSTAVDEGLASRLLVAGGGQRIRFAHALIADTLYETVDERRRCYLHRAIAEVLAALPAPPSAAVAHHFGRAGPECVDRAITHARHAADEAMGLSAYEEAARLYQFALDACDRTQEHNRDDAERARLLLALAAALARSRDTRAAQVYKDAFVIARRAGVVEIMALAAMGESNIQRVDGHPDQRVTMCEAALEALGPEVTPLRTRVLALLAAYLRFIDVERARRCIAEAISSARQLDASTLFLALKCGHFIFWQPDVSIETRVGMADEMAGLARALGSPESAADAIAWRLADLIEVGDVARVKRELPELVDLAEGLRQPYYRFLAASIDFIVALLEGRLDDGEGLALDADPEWHRTPGPTGIVTAACLLSVQLARGRFDEAERTARDMSALFAPVPVAALRAYALAEQDREADARAAVEEAFAEMATRPRDVFWIVATCLLSVASARVRDTKAAAALEGLLAPYAARNVFCLAGPVTVLGWGTRYLGLLAMTLGRFDEAARHFEEALVENARMGARPWLAWTQHDYAALLLARGHEGDGERAHALLGAAAKTAAVLGLPPLAARVAALARGSPPPPGVPALEGIFVGRAKEIVALRVALAAAIGGRGRVVLLVGEPGIGKTRTAEELVREARAVGAEVLTGRCYEGEGTPAFWPWRQVLRAYVAGRDTATLAAELGDATAVATVCPELRIRLPDIPALALDPERARFRLFEGVTGMLRRAAARRPLVIVLDDLHGADRSSLLLLEFLARDLGRARLLVVGGLRDVTPAPEHPLAQTLSELAREHVSDQLALPGLDVPEISELIVRATGEACPPGLAEAVHARTEGNPRYVTEVVRALFARGPIAAPTEEPWRLDVPETVRTMVARRVGELSAPCRALLVHAALFGRDCQVAVLARASRLDAKGVLTLLDEAVAARMVTLVAGEPGHVRFVHALFGEVLVDELPPSRRAAFHLETAEALAGDARAEDMLAEIAHHYGQAGPAGDPMQAVACARRAGDRALGLLAHEEAARLYGLAATALTWLSTPDETLEVEILLALGEAHRRYGGRDAAEETFGRAATLARRLGSAELLTRATRGTPDTPNLLRCEGDYWTIAFAGRMIRLRDMRGLRYLAQLLTHPGRKFHATELVRGHAAGTDTPADTVGLTETVGLGDAGRALDARARQEYGERLAALDAELADAERLHDLGRLAHLQAERDALREELMAALRPGVASAAERARLTVTKGIGAALAKIAASHPALAAHLAATVRRGNFCAYVPDPHDAVEWVQ